MAAYPQLLQWRTPSPTCMPDADQRVVVNVLLSDLTTDWDGAWWSGEAWHSCETGGPLPGTVVAWATVADSQQPCPDLQTIRDSIDGLVTLLDEVRSQFTRDDDLPNDLLPRIDAMVNAWRRNGPAGSVGHSALAQAGG